MSMRWASTRSWVPPTVVLTPTLTAAGSASEKERKAKLFAAAREYFKQAGDRYAGFEDGHPPGVDAVGGDHPRVDREVGGRESDLPAERFSPDDLAPQPVGAPENPRRSPDVSRLEELAHPRGRPPAVGAVRDPRPLDDLYPEPHLGAELAHRVRVADVAPPERRVVSDDDRRGAEAIDANELARLRNTIPWEVVTAMSTRVTRVYHAGSVLKSLRTLHGEVRAAETA